MNKKTIKIIKKENKKGVKKMDKIKRTIIIVLIVIGILGVSYTAFTKVNASQKHQENLVNEVYSYFKRVELVDDLKIEHNSELLNYMIFKNGITNGVNEYVRYYYDAKDLQDFKENIMTFEVK